MFKFSIRSMALVMVGVAIPCALFAAVPIYLETVPLWFGAILISWAVAGFSFGHDVDRSYQGAMAGLGLAILFLVCLMIFVWF